MPFLLIFLHLLPRMETVKITSTRGQAKVLGTLVCIGGALTFTFWKGRYLLEGFVQRPLINICSTNISVCELSHGKDNWIKGSALILTSHVAWSAWLILQVTSYISPNNIYRTTYNVWKVPSFNFLFIFHLLILRLWSRKSTQQDYRWLCWSASLHHCNLFSLPCFLQGIQPYGSWNGTCSY